MVRVKISDLVSCLTQVSNFNLGPFLGFADVIAVTGFEHQRCSASGGGRRALRPAVSAAAAAHTATQVVVERADIEAR